MKFVFYQNKTTRMKQNALNMFHSFKPSGCMIHKFWQFWSHSRIQFLIIPLLRVFCVTRAPANRVNVWTLLHWVLSIWLRSCRVAYVQIFHLISAFHSLSLSFSLYFVHSLSLISHRKIDGGLPSTSSSTHIFQQRY